MIVLRFFAFIFLLAAAIAFVADLTPLLNGTGPFAPASLAWHWHNLAPHSVQAAEAAVTRVSGAWTWRVLAAVLNIPAFVFFGALGVFSGYLGRRRRQIVVFAN